MSKKSSQEKIVKEKLNKSDSSVVSCIHTLASPCPLAVAVDHIWSTATQLPQARTTTCLYTTKLCFLPRFIKPQTHKGLPTFPS